ALTGKGRYRDAAESSLRLVAAFADRYPTGFAQWLIAADFSLAPVIEVAIVGEPRSAAVETLLVPLAEGYRPNQVIAVARDPGASRVELMADRIARNGSATAYVCRGFACRLPVTDAAALRQELQEITADGQA